MALPRRTLGAVFVEVLPFPLSPPFFYSGFHFSQFLCWLCLHLNSGWACWGTLCFFFTNVVVPVRHPAPLSQIGSFSHFFPRVGVTHDSNACLRLQCVRSPPAALPQLPPLAFFPLLILRFAHRFCSLYVFFLCLCGSVSPPHSPTESPQLLACVICVLVSTAGVSLSLVPFVRACS